MTVALAAALYFDRELAANAGPFVSLVEALTPVGHPYLQWHIPIKRKGPPPLALNLGRLVARIISGETSVVGVETALRTPDPDTLFIGVDTTPVAKRPRTLTACRYEAFVGLGVNRVKGVDAILAFADAVAVRAGTIFVAETAASAKAMATCGGGAALSQGQIDRINDSGLYWQPHWGDVIRGPAWGTFLGAHHVDKLGGMTRIERESGCARVIALSSGGAYLQTTPEPTDVVPEALGRFLEPVRHP
jgi:hypothetical protein